MGGLHMTHPAARFYLETPDRLKTVTRFPRRAGFFAALCGLPGALPQLTAFFMLWLLFGTILSPFVFHFLPSLVWIAVALVGVALLRRARRKADDVPADPEAASAAPGVEFNFKTGEIYGVTTMGKRVEGSLSEVAALETRVERRSFDVTLYYCVVTWDNPLKPILRYSPVFLDERRLQPFIDEITPKINDRVIEYRVGHLEAGRADGGAGSTDELGAADAPSSYRRDDQGFQRWLASGPAMLGCAVLLLVLWVFPGRGAGMRLDGLILYAVFFVYAFWFYIEPKKISVVPPRREIILMSGFGPRKQTFGFDRVERIVVKRLLSLAVPTLYLSGRSGVTLGMGFDFDKALALARETRELLEIREERAIEVE